MVVKLNKHLELNSKTSPVNNNPSLGLVPGFGFDPAKVRVRKADSQDINAEESADECDSVFDDCEI
jgi:hypothetical protein